MSVMLDEEVRLGNESRYKNFVVAIERALKQFEVSNEWMDLIRYLDRLTKCIEANAQFQSIPKRITVLKRLAECLYPKLPPGVHLKTLKIYETIFQTIPKRDLQRDIILYSYGIFSLLPLAALAVKPVLLNLYESYFLPLGEALNPILSGFLIGLFSALEEGADYYDRIVTLLDRLANQIDEFYFYTSVWSSINLAVPARHAAIVFVLNHFDKRKNIEDQYHLIGLSTEIMVSAVCACLHDDNDQSLVRRSTLDFLLTCLPIHQQKLKRIQLIQIINAVLPILLKRDMSLNRRIYAWFLGTNKSSTHIATHEQQREDAIDPSSYFTTYTQEIVLESLRNLLETFASTNNSTNNKDNNQPADVSDIQQPIWTLNQLLRILLALIDKADVGPNIIESIFMNYLVLVYELIYQPAKKSIANNVQEENDYSETLKTFNLLLDTLEPYFIWEYLTKNFDIILSERQEQGSLASGTTLKQLCGIIDMLLDISPFESSREIQSEHLPEMLYGLIKIMNNNIEKLTPAHTNLCIQISMKILNNIIPSDANHHLSMFYRSTSVQEYNFEDNPMDSDSEDENDSLLLHMHSTLTTEQQEYDDTHVVERLLHRMVRKVEKEFYRFSRRKSVQFSSKVALESINHIDKTIKLYKIFFHRFILNYFINENQISSIDQFQTIYSILQQKTNDRLPIIFNRYQQENQFDFKLNDNLQQYKAAFEDCCKLLIEFCCFSKQSSNNDQTNSSKNTNTIFSWKEKSDLDDWLIDLCVLSLCRTGYFDFQTISISVLTELFNYILENSTVNGHETDSLGLFLDKIDFFPYLIAYLWEYLSDKYQREQNFQAAYSLIILHSMLPNNSCEELICQELSLKDNQHLTNETYLIEGYQRFFKLWNTTRDLFNRTKSFEQSLIHVLSILQESNHSCLKTMVEQWINDCFIYGDMCRIFNALLIMLLHSDTARESLQQLTDDSIVANPSPEINERFVITFSLNSLVGYSKDDDGDDDQTIDESDVEQENSTKRKRSRATSWGNTLENSNQLKSSPQTNKFSSISTISQPIISNFLSFSPSVISRAVKNRPPIISPTLIKNSDPVETNSSRSYSMPSDSNPNHVSVDPQDAYILFYVQAYDFNRVLLSLNIIENLINLLPQQLIHYLLITSNIQTSDTNMQELFLKNCQAFDPSNANNQEYQSYLYLLLNTLLIFTYTYQQNSQHIQENCCVQIHSLIILARMCHELSTICMDNHALMTYTGNLLKKVSFQKILLCLFNRLMSKRMNFFQIQSSLHDQLIEQYLKEFLHLLKEMILLENILSSSTDSNDICQPIVYQTRFLSTILQCLKRLSFIRYHRMIIDFVIEIFPHCSSALKIIIIRIVEQICRNLCFIIQYHHPSELISQYPQVTSVDIREYIIDLIKRLSYIWNYCLGESNNHTQLLVQTLCPQQWMKRITVNTNDLSDARQVILTKFPTIFSSLLFIWKSLSIDHTHSIWLGNNIKHIRELIIDFLSSLTKSHGLTFIRAVIQYWSACKRQQQNCSKEQIHLLINILKQINNYSINEMIYNLNELIHNPTKKTNSIVFCLQFLYVYLKEQKNVSIACWTTLAVMFKECLAQSTSASVTFLIIKILNIYIKQSPSLVEKRDVKDLQDITIRVLDNCNTIVASSLEQTNWLRKNLQVRLAQSDVESTTMDSSNELDHNPDLDINNFDLDDTTQSSNSSLIALNILAEYAAKLLDTVYNLTDDKDRVVVPYVQNLVVNLMPYFRTHVLCNAPSYRAASTLLMNISQYSYMKKAWKKEAFDHLFDSKFFQVDLASLRSWKVIVENMLSNEKSISFRDLLTRINTVQIGLFISKEQEYEQRAMLIKRFAFVIYASDRNHNNRYSEDIFNCITELIKLPQVPIIHSQMFLFFRILIIRLSNRNFMTFWPTVISELIQVLLLIEQDLIIELEGDNNKSNLQRMTTNDLSLTSSQNGSLRMYLNACKLLDVLLAMPYVEVDYFQLVRSAFLADYGTTNPTVSTDTFTTFSIRLVKLFERKLQTMPTSIRDQLPIIQPRDYPLLRLRNLSNNIELYPFFHCLMTHENDFSQNDIKTSSLSDHIETSILEDFIELWI